MVLVLVIGDLHIPDRIHDLPAKFKKLLVPGKIQQIICTGQCRMPGRECRARGLRRRGVPVLAHIQHTPIRVGVIHGHQSVPMGDLDALAAVARQMDVDVLVFFVNPGSATGAWTGAWSGDVIPSFALMDIQGPVVVTYIYQLVDQDPPVRVEKVEWRKPDNHPLPPPPVARSPPPETTGSPVGGSVW
ncbi:Metallo-dependent phosphatase [Auriculariales sp. MPI-PUGE-AT-0066]|nr:Metallo-dependent phosphatase [Auriculariales sp. MPI-PUGE-AT-0066]